MAKRFRYNQLTLAQLGIITTGVTIPITKLRMRLDDGTKVDVLPPGGKAQFDDGDEIDIDAVLLPGKKNKRLERQLRKDPRFTSRP
jgi:hypothetical protein